MRVVFFIYSCVAEGTPMGPHPWIHKALLAAKELDVAAGAACSEALRLLRGRAWRGWVISGRVVPRFPGFPIPKFDETCKSCKWKLNETIWDDWKTVLFWLLWFSAFADMSISGHPRLFTPTSMQILNSCRGPQHGAQGVFYICMMQMSKHSLMWHAIKV